MYCGKGEEEGLCGISGRRDGFHSWAEEASIVNAFEGLGFANSGGDGDGIAGLERGKGGGSGGDMIQGVVFVLDVDGIFCGPFALPSVEGFHFVFSDREDFGIEGDSLSYRVVARGVFSIHLFGDFRLDLGIDSGKDGPGKGAKGVRGTVSGFEGFSAIDGEGGGGLIHPICEGFFDGDHMRVLAVIMRGDLPRGHFKNVS